MHGLHSGQNHPHFSLSFFFLVKDFSLSFSSLQIDEFAANHRFGTLTFSLGEERTRFTSHRSLNLGLLIIFSIFSLKQTSF